MFETIMTILIAVAPALTAIIGIVAGVIKLINYSKHSNKEVMNAFNDLKAEVVATKEYEELKAEYKVSLEHYNELLKKYNELLTKIDHIERK